MNAKILFCNDQKEFVYSEDFFYTWKKNAVIQTYKYETTIEEAVQTLTDNHLKKEKLEWNENKKKNKNNKKNLEIFIDEEEEQFIEYDDIKFEYDINYHYPKIKCASVFRIIERVTFEKYIDNIFINEFLLNFYTFCDPSLFFDLLKDRFFVDNPQQKIISKKT